MGNCPNKMKIERFHGPLYSADKLIIDLPAITCGHLCQTNLKNLKADYESKCTDEAICLRCKTFASVKLQYQFPKCNSITETVYCGYWNYTLLHLPSKQMHIIIVRCFASKKKLRSQEEQPLPNMDAIIGSSFLCHHKCHMKTHTG